MTWTEPVGVVEIAECLGVSRRTVDQWRQRGQFIAAKGNVGAAPPGTGPTSSPGMPSAATRTDDTPPPDPRTSAGDRDLDLPLSVTADAWCELHRGARRFPLAVEVGVSTGQVVRWLMRPPKRAA